MSASSPIISHVVHEGPLGHAMRKISTKITARGPLPHATVERQLDLLHQLSEFPLGRFLIQNRGVNGYWTHYFLTYPWMPEEEKRKLSDLENTLLSRAPLILATQERFRIFLKENQKSVHDGARLACLPSGLLGELLYLDFKGISSIELVGIDYDQSALDQAGELAEKRGLKKFVELQKSDAWALAAKNKFDLISSNGLNIYEPSDEKVTALYKICYEALKPNGKFVTSFVTPPPILTPSSEWLMPHINLQDLLLQKIIFSDILDARFQCFRSSQETHEQLTNAGFKKIEFIYDQARMFPTVVGCK